MNVANIPTAPGAVTPLFPIDPAVLAIALERHGRQKFEAFVEIAIDLLDSIDGDSDAEPDDEDTGTEDDPDGIDPEVDHCVDDAGEEDRVYAAPVCSYDIDQTGPLPRADACPDIPCADIAIQTRRPVLSLRLGRRA